MKICFVTCDTLNAFWQEKLDKLSKPFDALVFGFNGLPLVSYKKELSGETEYFQDVAKLSKQIGSVVISGCDTDTYGVYRHSAVIADRGKILGVTDMAHTVDDSEFVSGGNYRVYDTAVGRIGLIVGEDIYFSDVPKILSLCDSDIIISVFKKVENSLPQIMIRAGAFTNGTTIAMCSENSVQIADIKGDIILSCRKNVVEADVKIEKDYHLISTRRRGICKKFNAKI